MTALQCILAAAPDWLRHAAILYASTAAGVILKGIVAAGGITGVDWTSLLADAIDTGAATTAAGLLLLTATPATRRYGAGSKPPAKATP